MCLGGVLVVPGPRLDPLPLALFGGGDKTRIGGASILVALRCGFDCEILFGIAGTGGASGALGTPLDGEGSRNVRSDIDPLLPRRSRGGRDDPATELPTDDVEPDLRIIRFV